ncbi:MAG: YgiQ family radical SAM protein [Planctomycetota bacterium]
MFLPTTRDEIKKLGWDKPDIILITGDAYLDSSYVGVAVIGKVLSNAGYKVAIIGQPDIYSEKDITRLGEPELFWGVTAGAVDSMVANYTASKKRKKHDDFTPTGENNKRPDRASIVYSNLIRKYFKNTKPIILGGIEASLRRIAHYDYWDDDIRRSVLFDAKADALVYGMGEKAIVELAGRLKQGLDFSNVRGICYISNEPTRPVGQEDGFVILPSYDEVKNDKLKFIEMFHTFYANNDPITAKGLCQKQDTRYLVQNPPSEHLTTAEIDDIYDIDYERDVHPYYKKQGEVRALDTIRFAITSHRGCYGECNFCSLTVHQGTTVISRSEESIIKEAEKITGLKGFTGYISDVGGPTANTFGIECEKKLKKGICKDKRCLHPVHCKTMKINHKKQIELLRNLRKLKGIKKVFIGSGIRYDMVLEDKKYGLEYMKEIINHHVSGQLKIAPEHTEYEVLRKMGKTRNEYLQIFKDEFYRLTQEAGKKQFLTYYFIAAHPDCSYKDMEKLKWFIKKELMINPEQVQIFTPTPSTYSTLMYYTEMDPFTPLEKSSVSKKEYDCNRYQSRQSFLTGFTYEKIFVEKDIKGKELQKSLIVSSRTTD